MMDTVAKMRNVTAQFNGDFSFLNEWEFWVDGTSATLFKPHLTGLDAASELEQLTLTGPYAGGLDAFTTGVKFRSRFPNLAKSAKDKKVKIWASASDRVIASARYLQLGLFGLDANLTSAVEVIPEAESRGGDTLTPADTCSSYQEDPVNGHDSGDIHLAEFQAKYLPPVAERIAKDLLSMVRTRKKPDLSFTPEEVFSMQEMCGYETSARGRSPWCDVFTRDEWASFEYARDIMHFYRSGPGNKWGTVLGTLWLNATARLLEQAPSATGPFFMSFSHDSDIIPVLATLKLLDDGAKLPTDRVLRDRKWRTSQVVPMGGRIAFERMQCDGGRGAFVRLNINDGLVAVPGCVDGPNLSCSLGRFLKYVDDKVAAAGDFKAKCGLGREAPRHITFLHQ
jgi:acid phosphatase